MTKDERMEILEKIDRIEKTLNDWANYKFSKPGVIDELIQKKERLYAKLDYAEL